MITIAAIVLKSFKGSHIKFSLSKNYATLSECFDFNVKEARFGLKDVETDFNSVHFAYQLEQCPV